jgi:DNA-binding XRE family transcriptional regulator
MTTFRTAPQSALRSKSARSGAALAGRLFSPRSEERRLRSAPDTQAPDTQASDAQACIRSALRRRRRALGLTQQQSARLLGMSRLTYHRIETGARRIHFADLAAVCKLYDCHPVELLQDSELAAAYAHAATLLDGAAR